MSKLQELIQELCPEGVEFRKLGEVCNVYTGGEPPKDSIKGDSKDKNHPYPIWANGKEVYGYASTYKIDKDATVISSIGANTGTIYFREAYFTPIIRLKVIIPKDNNLLSKFLYYYLSTLTFVVKSSSVPNMNSNEVKEICIPLPPLPIQEEIVRILEQETDIEQL
jgi:type I restriction enzyme S subunit